MNVNVDSEHFRDQYIYLDWNVFKYIKNPRQDKREVDEDFSQVVCLLKEKYRFPTSLAHIKDRLKNYSEIHRNNIEDDFEFAYKFSEGKFVTNIDLEGGLGIVNTDIRGLIDEYLNNCESERILNEFFDYGSGIALIDIDKLDLKHPMYEYLKNHNAELNENNMEKFLEDLYKHVFDDNTKYSALRDWIRTFDFDKATFNISNISEMCMLNKLMYKLGPFLLSFNCADVDELTLRWKDIAKRYFGEIVSDPPHEQLLMQGYILLDMHPLMKKEKLKKRKNTLDNIIRDGNHCYYAS